MTENRAILSRIEHFMNSTIRNNNSTEDVHTASEITNNFLGKLPCQTKEQLEEVEYIITDPKCMKELVSTLIL